MSDPFHDQPIPRGALWAIAAIVAFSLVAVTAARLAGYQPSEVPASDPVESRDLRFEDMGAGLVHVYDDNSQVLVTTLEPGTENFVRGVLRSLARERRSMDIASHAAIRLTRHGDGRLTLDDKATGRRIDLVAFGPTNVASFARFLEPTDCGDSPPGAPRSTDGGGIGHRPADGAQGEPRCGGPSLVGATSPVSG